MSKKLIINGKYYPMWQQFVDKKAQWVGGKIFNIDMGMTAEAKLTDIRLKPNGDDSAMIVFDCIYEGKPDAWSIDVSVAGIGANNTGIEGLCISGMYVGDFILQKKVEGS
jgi:hypothetical protein